MMYGYCCIGFIDYMFRGKTLTDFTIFFSPYNFEKRDEGILDYFLKWSTSIIGSHMYDTKEVFLQLDDPLGVRLIRIKEIRGFFIAEVNDRGKMSKTLNKFITAIDYADKSLLVLSGTSSGVFLCSFSTVIGMPVRIASASISLMFLISNAIVKMFLKTMGKKKNKHRKIACLARVKLSSIEKNNT